jgi:predicted enzyme related to lactoylglutathione lyase
MFKKIRTVVYHVGNLEKAKEWYINITGIQPYFDEPFYVGFDINGCELGLDPDMTGIEQGNHSFMYWAVDDIEGCVTRLIAAGAVVVEALKEVGGGIKVVVVNDLWGNAVGLIEGEEGNIVPML